MEEGIEFADVTSKMAFFVILVNAWKLLTNVTNVTKSSILDAAGVLDMPLFLCVIIYVNYEYFRLTYIKLFLWNMYTCVCDGVYVCTQTQIYTCIYMYIYIYVYIYIYMFIYIYIYMYISLMYVYTSIHIYTHVHKWIYKVHIFIFHKNIFVIYLSAKYS